MSSYSLASAIRAKRLGFGFSHKRQCWIRISEHLSGGWLIELCPANAVPSKLKVGFHRCWWENGGEILLSEVAWLRAIKRVKRYFCFVVDDEGNEV